MGKIIRNGIEFCGTSDTADNIIYDNKDSGLAATNTQTAIDELSEKVKSGGNIVYLTKAEYEALPDSKLTDDVEYRITDANTASKIAATDVTYGDTTVEEVIDEVQESVSTLNESLEEQPQFVYDEEGKITGYTTKIGGADTVFPFINDDILVCARLQPTNSQETAFSVGNFKIPSDGVYKIYFVSSTSYWSSGTVTIGNDIAFEIPTYNNYTAGNHIFEEERECKTGEEINIISQVVAGTLCILLYKIT